MKYTLCWKHERKKQIEMYSVPESLSAMETCDKEGEVEEGLHDE